MARLAIAIGFALSAHCLSGVRANDPASADYFEQHIRPVLVESCFGCHSAEAGTVEGGLLLDNRAAIERGGEHGVVIVAGDPSASRLVQAIVYGDPALQMPPDGRLPEETIEHFRTWIAAGALDPRDGPAPPPPSTIRSRSATHWAFQKPVRPTIPLSGQGWARRPLDALIAAKLESSDLRPAPPADIRQLVRRVYYDLTGLPPTFEQVEAVAADTAPDAYERVVDELLASPQFAERWARHWLDVARFADTKGYVFTEDRTFPAAYRYRDWVIEAFNHDMPIDQFLRNQIAADLYDNAEQNLPAQGFVTLGRRFINNPHDIAADRIDVVFRGMMGLTVGCARCHDHKFDPVSIDDYYALYGVFDSCSEVQDADRPLRLVERDDAHDAHVLLRGNAGAPGNIVSRGVPAQFASLSTPVASGSGRRELADAIANPQNPLTARVYVNRVWGHLFGKPLVSTPSDFGLRTDAPVQQDVLDLLAVDFVAHGWSFKWLVREIVTSSTYQQSSRVADDSFARDPENNLLSHSERRRLDFEALRDSLLVAAERLDKQVGGPSEEINTADGGKRRTLYAHIDRQNLPSVFRTFDFASPDAHCPERAETLVPQQALFLLNSPFAQDIARDVAAKVTGDDTAQRVTLLYRRVLQRDPSDSERELAVKYVDQADAGGQPGLALLAQTLLMSNEFVFLD